MKLETYRKQFQQELSVLYPLEEVQSLIHITFDYVLKMSRLEVSLSRNQTLSISELTALNEVLQRLLASEPIQYIIGSTEFYGLHLRLNKDTLIPRPETEELVDWIIALHKETARKLKVLDIGTGSGCIAIALAKHLMNAEVDAIDISNEALEMAKQNAKSNDVTVTFFQQDILKTMFLDRSYDIIVSNPPYVRMKEKAQMRDNVLVHEPHRALFVEDDSALLFYEKIAALAKQHLTISGTLFFEINEYLSSSTSALVSQFGFKNIEVRADIFGKDRMLSAVQQADF